MNAAAAHVDALACDGCGLCEAVCDYGAIAMVRV
jgi:Pyruvate/2-oxoacid:ferredoxin oxidoreductase delta subunit